MPRRLPPSASIVRLLKALVNTPSRAGEDDLLPVLRVVEAWLKAHGLRYRRLKGDSGTPLGLYAETVGQAQASRRPFYVLNATLDTAGFGDPSTWQHPPHRAVVADGWLHGRGSADSKAGASIFAHLFRHFAMHPQAHAGRLGLLFDLEEHSGVFAGARCFFEASSAAPRPDGVLIGYPGIDRLVVGSRGFLRARMVVPGVAAHSGASQRRGVNAVHRAARLVEALQDAPLPPAPPHGFGRPAQLTVTSVHGGLGFAQVPDRCEVGVDIRLTTDFDDARARRWVQRIVDRLDRREDPTLATRIEWLPGWPAYRVDEAHPMVVAMREAARDQLGSDIACDVVGPSNIGNYLAARGIPALCGFGVRSLNLHAADERIELATIGPVYRTYEDALARLLAR